MLDNILAGVLGICACWLAWAGSDQMWVTPPHDAGSEEFAGRVLAFLAIAASFAAGLLL